ncbi:MULTISPECIES: 50S ribosomal protein L35 [Blastopirellula]|uniref:Large ribosomal subunit protein bL35 n=2 Tax=Blastopirellula TaxID=265487 RepID=A0A2S8GU34_9BACT|nr:MULTISPECIES: 50S ribosomal protein L35 [Blastopirellula]MCC9607377.1 50S ribosomal protein L35 [Blastopirellula sediminis]MCC9629330.1 50S ribosomal protein L35 [Blastopirellula sediminis]PQO35139.1 50S ribosomal protein L35 [Blastopirellula marina]PQO47929.1 50S ribosomal protein L35 [Blastopirellula marina]PTL43888.1 50S ribosomal protein L35 [Blastopirellula marina]
MPKMKTHKGTKKRFRLTAKGHIKHRQCGTSHLATRLSPKRTRGLRGTRVLAEVDEPMLIKALNGYSY